MTTTDAQTEAREIVSAALPPHEQAMLGVDAIVVLADLIANALATKDEKIQALNDECQQSMLDIAHERDRAERAEAQLAEANKALDAIIERSHNDPLGTSKVIDMRKIAIRALEAQGGENNG